MEILKRVSGVEVSRLWLLHDESFKEFFDWFGQSVDEDNLITDSLLREYTDLENAGLVLSEEEVQAELDRFGTVYPNILDYIENDLAEREEQLDQLIAIEEQYEKLIAEAKRTESQLIKELSELDMKLIDGQFHQGRVATECGEKANFLQEIQSHTQQQIFDMHQCYVQKQNPPLFIYQMPIEQFNMKCDQFLKYLEMYIRRHFSVRKAGEDPAEIDDPDQDHRDVIVQLESIKARLDLGEMKLVDARKEYHGLRKMMERFQDLSWQPMKISAMKKLCVELKGSNAQDLLRIDVLKQELEMYVRQLNEQKIECILYENSKLKLDRAINRLGYIERLSTIISDALMNAEMLWILMQLDLEKIRNKFDNSDEMNSETQRCLKRIEMLKAVGRISVDEEALEEFVAQFASAMGAINLNSSGNRSMSLRNCIQDYADYKKRVFKNLQSVAGGKYYKSLDEAMKELKITEKQLERYVFDGPVNRPQFFDQQYQERIQRLSFEMDQIEKQLKTLKTDYQQNINEPKNNDKFWRYNQNLWVWFLTEPKKVAIAIKEVTAAASQMTAYKSISGIKCKSMADEMKY